MKSIIISSVVAVVLLCLAGSVSAGPQIEIKDGTFNFGRVVQRATISHTFWIKSTGDEDLHITKVVPGCGCTKAPLMDSVLAPGDSTRLDIFFSTKSFRGFVTKRPYLETNASDEKTYVKIMAELIPEPQKGKQLVINPPTLDVSQFTEKPRRKGKFLISNRSDQDYKITVVDYASDYFDVDMPKKIGAGETVEGVITVHKNRIPEEFEHSLTFMINDDLEQRYTLPIKRQVRIKKK